MGLSTFLCGKIVFFPPFITEKLIGKINDSEIIVYIWIPNPYVIYAEINLLKIFLLTYAYHISSKEYN